MVAREPYADRSLAVLLTAMAQRVPAPSGGAGAAWTCAIAAALAGMAARYASDEDDEMLDVADRADELRETAVNLADMDAETYQAYLASPPDRRAEARSAAADPPLLIARAAAEVAVLATGAMLAGPKHLQGDARTAVVLAEAAASAAVGLVEIDLADDPADGRLTEARAIADAVASARRRAEDSTA
jgi:formiminotetrahydrofolate cyclodeaminase